MFLLYFAASEPHMVGFEYAEHGRLGDRLKLYNTDGSVYIAWTKPFMLSNGLKVTYGQINGLGGDFYGTAAPISDGIDFQDSVSRFLTAFHWLASDETRNPGEATEILNVLQQEVDLVNKAIDGKTDPSVFYAKYDKDETATFERITFSGPDGVPGYIGLAQINWDHFGADARKAYTAGHYAAIQVAVKGDLELTYAMIAHADHFLEDSFSAGHMRTPRRVLHNEIGTAGLCARVQSLQCYMSP